MPYTIETLGEDALLLRFGDAIDAAVNARVHVLSQRIERVRPPWLRDLVPAYASLALFVDADAFDCTLEPLDEARRWLQRQAFTADDAGVAGRFVEIPVSYGGEHGPDLTALAIHAGLGEDDVIARYEHDPAWPSPVWGRVAARPYTPELLVERIALLRETLLG